VIVKESKLAWLRDARLDFDSRLKNSECYFHNHIQSDFVEAYSACHSKGTGATAWSSTLFENMYYGLFVKLFSSLELREEQNFTE
jgi:hypothetical protein